MLISSSSRYSIYKVQFASPLRGSLLTISHTFPFVKKFFLLFSNFFAVPFAALFAEQLGYLSTPDSVCQELFSFLFKFYPGFAVFPLSSQTACIYYQIPHALSSPFPKKIQKKFRHPFGCLNTVFHYSVSSIKPYPPSFLRYTTAKLPPLSSSRNAKKLWPSRFICMTASSRVIGLK